MFKRRLGRLGGEAIAKRLCFLIAGAAMTLAGCGTVPHEQLSKTRNQADLPEQQLPDYLFTPCPALWPIETSDAMTNPLYWLRAMECAGRLSVREAYAKIDQQPQGVHWQYAFKRGILLSETKPTPVERRRYLISLDTLADDIPPSVRPLFIVWRDGQRAQLTLSVERGNSEKQEASLQAEIKELQQQLAVTTGKLDNLADIERQLSARKPRGNVSPALPKDASAAMPALQPDKE